MSSVDAPFKYLVKMFESGDIAEMSCTTDRTQNDEIKLHERLFQQLNEIYNHPQNGLIAVGQKVGVEILPLKRKVTILLIGNHSAGKSSFINWYIEDNVQKTGMAIETQLFSVVASGRKRETLMGPATVFLFPHLKPLDKMEGVSDYLCAEISTSKKRQFSMITFIDTPGLVDGGMEYPYDVNDAILFLGGVADLIFVFFDPIGLALCKRTMSVVERINSLYPEKLHFYLSKSDEIRKQTDKQKIMMQITQEVCRRSGLNRSGFTMPGIYVPTLARTPVVQKQASNPSANSEKLGYCQSNDSLNEIEEVCKQIEQTVGQTLQIALNNYGKDINLVLKSISDRLTANKEIAERNCTFLLLYSSAVVLLLALLISTILQYLVHTYGINSLSVNFHINPDVLQVLVVPGNLILTFTASQHTNHVSLACLFVSVVALYLFYCKMRLKPTLPRRDVKELERLKVFVMSYLVKKKMELTQEYLGDSFDL